ncbi:group II intron maturase-specific domain-containing protein [Okeania sp.]|uniref:group II intron maturase-specific domain-containing protein n=1 Tax=Okeania sp. TaxID=3100323 RepID=UPI002B4AD15C|nr:group II intron maturase-specific domain-containing protein [Okeania sp.]MEB3341417.1 group II intron maturase-specific domain-containing protein [Okeania sp.]
MSNTSLKTTGEWKEWRNINWLKVERRVFKLQKRIYNASQRGDVIAVRKLQKMLLKSWYGKLLAVRSSLSRLKPNPPTPLSDTVGGERLPSPCRKGVGEEVFISETYPQNKSRHPSRVNQSSQGEKIAAVGSMKSLSPEKCFALAKRLKLNKKVKPVTSTVEDFARQILVKIALEKQWEPKFHIDSHGLMLGKSCQDTIEAIVNCVKFQPKYVLKADITNCFDCLDNEQLLQKLDTYPTLRKQIRVWLKDRKKLFLTDEVISPLLVNIVFFGIEKQIKYYAETLNNKCESLSLIRYGNSLAIAHKNIEVIQKCQDIITEYLSELFGELKPSQIRIYHTLNKCGEEKAGFEFLGFNIRQYQVSKNQSKLGFQTKIKPSKESIKIHYCQIAEVIDKHKSAPQIALIRKLNPLVKNWVNYYSKFVSKKTFHDVDSLIFQKLWVWAKRRHSNKNNHWICQKYWQTIEGKNREFSGSSKNGNQVRLLRHGDWIYWSKKKALNI